MATSTGKRLPFTFCGLPPLLLDFDASLFGGGLSRQILGAEDLEIPHPLAISRYDAFLYFRKNNAKAVCTLVIFWSQTIPNEATKQLPMTV